MFCAEGRLPTYEYECKSCQHRFDERQSFSSEPVATCPLCTNGARRVFHAVPVVFKGSGFYVNDYGKGSSTDTSGESSSAKKDDASSAAAASETDTASKGGSENSSESKSQAGSETAAAASKSG